ncbi:YbaB/EbfC family nucleoid-associated protein [Streptomyces sp. NPDC102274]|uniref:YbaB/EbfC family nucleoid-associated protein n=1 Tax=Streptomyces sp. NPDC102274 TaxID=3366151 RepID=UPI0037F3B407
MSGSGERGDAEAISPSLSIGEKLAEAMAELEAIQAGVAEAEKELREASVTVRSKDRAVEVTVGPQGELVTLRFLDNKYRTMAASELAASVLESVGQAKTQMARRVMEVFKPFTEPSTTVTGLTGVDVDWEKILGPDVLEDPQTVTRRRRGRRQHD